MAASSLVGKAEKDGQHKQAVEDDHEDAARLEKHFLVILLSGQGDRDSIASIPEEKQKRSNAGAED